MDGIIASTGKCLWISPFDRQPWQSRSGVSFVWDRVPLKCVHALPQTAARCSMKTNIRKGYGPQWPQLNWLWTLFFRCLVCIFTKCKYGHPNTWICKMKFLQGKPRTQQQLLPTSTILEKTVRSREVLVNCELHFPWAECVTAATRERQETVQYYS